MHRRRPGHRAAAGAGIAPAAGARALVGGALALAALSLLWPSQPGYDAWAWLLWGREIAHGTLDTVGGPAWKPLPVAVCALLTPLGGAAPEAWLVVARAGALAAVALAGALAWRLARPGATHSVVHRGAVAVVAAGGVALAQGFAFHAAVGDSEGLTLAFILAAILAALDGRHGWALAFALGAASLRPESWPFLGLYGLWLWRRREVRPVLAIAALAIPAVWFLPELAGSGDLLRSADRARVLEPGHPGTQDVPFAAGLRDAAQIPLAPIAIAGIAGLAHSRTRLLTAGALAWIALVALMAQRGYSGEARYALPAAAMLAVPAAIAAAQAPRMVVGLLLVALVPAVALRAGDLGGELRRAQRNARLWEALPRIDPACRPLATSRTRGTGVAYAMDVRKRDVDADPPWQADATVLIAREDRWKVRVPPGAPAACASSGPAPRARAG